jgi:hypothetical protein
MTNWKFGRFIAAIVAATPIEQAFAMQHKVYTCQSIHDRCVQGLRDNHKDNVENLSKCDKLLSTALSMGNENIGYWQGTLGTAMCLKKAL